MSGTTLDFETLINPDQKVCSKCSLTKSLDDFFKDKSCKNGVLSYCKECKKTQGYLWNKRNSERLKETQALYRRQNQDKSKVYCKTYRDKNPNKSAIDAARRRASLKNVSPPLTTDEQRQLKDFYWLTKDLYAISGQHYHVDHIIPISRGGLHHPSNLQILPDDMNLRKSFN